MNRKLKIILVMWVVLLFSGCTLNNEKKGDDFPTETRTLFATSDLYDYSIRGIKVAFYGDTGIVVVPKNAVRSTNLDYEQIQFYVELDNKLIFGGTIGIDRSTDGMVLRDTIDNIVHGFDTSYIKDKDNIQAVIKVELTINGKVEEETLMIDWGKLPKQ